MSQDELWTDLCLVVLGISINCDTTTHTSLGLGRTQNDELTKMGITQKNEGCVALGGFRVQEHYLIILGITQNNELIKMGRTQNNKLFGFSPLNITEVQLEQQTNQNKRVFL